MRRDCKACHPKVHAKYHKAAKRRALASPAPIAESQACGDCGETKPAAEFHRSKSRGSGLARRCMACASDYHRAYRATRRAELAAYHREWAEKNPLRVRVLGARAARRRRVAVKNAEGQHEAADVTRLWHRQRGECARCGLRFGPRPEAGGFHVDHVTPLSRGGSDWPRNLQLLCAPCNLAKGSKTPAEFTLYLRRLG